MSDIIPIEFVDSHCHLNLEEFNPDREQVIFRAQQNGVKKIVIPGVDIETSTKAVQLAQQYPGVYAAVGIHPNSGQTWTENSLNLLGELIEQPNVVAIGEIGLDYYRDNTPKDLQRVILEKQLELARETELPVIIHLRDSGRDLTEILLNWSASLERQGSILALKPGVLHAFSGGLEMAQELTAHHYKLGIGGAVTFKNARDIQMIVASLPIEALLLETDAPFLAPHPFRGKRNEPSNVRIVAEKIAELKLKPVELVARVTTQGAEKLFRWGGRH